MNLLFRTDASVAIGTGHVMRCLALAQACSDSGGRAIFAMAAVTPAVEERLRSEGFEVVYIAVSVGTDADADETARLAQHHGASWVVVDGYEFGGEYQSALKRLRLKVLFIDDNGHAEHYSADIVLNQNAHADENLYPNRETSTELLLGSRYVLLRREFQPWREWKREISAVGGKVLVAMGGSDPDNLTSLAIDALPRSGPAELEIVVAIGGSNPHLESVQRLAARCGKSVRLCADPSNIPELMAWADMALIAGGGTLWELLFMGCPVLSYARNPVQGGIVSELGREGVVCDLGHPQNFGPASIAAMIERLARSPERRGEMCALGRKRVDGKGASRICEVLSNHEFGKLLR